MSQGAILIVVGGLICVAGLWKMSSSSQSGGFNLKNIGITLGGSTTQTNTARETTSAEQVKTKTDYVGLAIAVIGLLTAIVGLLK